MDRLIEFATNHWELFLALAVTLVLLFRAFFGDRLGGYRSINASEATRLLNHEEALILDVREQGEYREGHIVDSVHIPLTTLKKRIVELEKYRARPIIVTCRTGARSRSACTLLNKDKFQPIYNLVGGIHAWQNAKLPLIKK